MNFNRSSMARRIGFLTPRRGLASILKKLAPAAAVPALLCSNPAAASYAQAGQIASFGVEQGKVFFITTGSRDAMPACATAGNRWVFNGSAAQGQAMMSALLTYYATGKQIVVQGTGACGDWGDTESVEYLWSVPN